jgi:outer membrane autotransporter protein
MRRPPSGSIGPSPSPGGSAPLARINFWHEFLGDSRTKISWALGFVPLPSDLGGTWTQMTAGVSAQVSRMVSLYAAANYQIGFDNARHAYDGKLGVRVNW